MKIYDISQEIFSSCVYPGDPAPKREVLCSTENGDVCNLSAFSMCAHNGTHIDAPFHFIEKGKGIDEIPPEFFVGWCYVSECKGDIGRENALSILKNAEKTNIESAKRILLKGMCTVTADAARVFSEKGIYLVGNESQTVGPEDAPMEVHKILLGAKICLLEGIRLSAVTEGAYFLCALPLNLKGCDGAPCRAVLCEM